MTRRRCFRPGDSIIVREFWRGRAWTTRSAIVVRDEPDLIATYVPPGAPCMTPLGPRGAYDRSAAHDEVRWEQRSWQHTHALSLNRPGQGWSTRLMWGEHDWSLQCWYLNVEEPLRRTTLGFDTMDDELDIVVHPDRRIERKDDDLLARWVQLGAYSQRDADRIRATADRAVASAERWESPLYDGWERWRPDPAWQQPTIPSGWDVVGPRHDAWQEDPQVPEFPRATTRPTGA